MPRMRSRRIRTLATMGALAGVLFFLAPRGLVVQAASPGLVLKVYSVGGVLTNDGTLWEYRPDRGRWMTIDAAFKEQGKTTHVLPLPVPATTIANMVTFGFFQTESGDCWLYRIDTDKWEKLPPVPGY
jgi:hypothetical protein